MKFVSVNMSKKLTDGQKRDVITLVLGGYGLVDAVAMVVERRRRIRAVPKSGDASEFMRAWRQERVAFARSD